MSQNDHTFTVTISGCSREQAEQVIAERIDHDEDYGFDYTISHREHRPQPRVSVCKCSAGDIRVTYPDGRVVKYIREPENHRHGAEVIDKPAPSYGITLDASSVKDEARDRFDNSPNNDFSEDDLRTVLAADDKRIERLINNLTEDSFWAEFDDVRSRVIAQLITEAP